jgi:glycosyltransferase involved in cell wall biosynthesis
MKPICLDLSGFDSIESLVSENNTIKNLHDRYGDKITVLSKFPAVFKENSYVHKSYKKNSVDMEYFIKNYQIIEPIRKKLLIITPHLSTGGAPQVTVNKIELIKDEFIIKVVEHDFLAWNYVVQRNRIMQLVGNENFITLGDKKAEQLAAVIKEFGPDVISMEEFPEMFMSPDTANVVYDKNRSWTILETTHDSSFNPLDKTCFPDKFIFVSPYSAFKYAHLDVPTEVIEYPMNNRERDKHAMQAKIGLDKSYKQITIVGLFTPRKNQGYAFELARHLEKYRLKFNFLGNQAGNFEHYWKPIMANKPDNCIIWGERDDVPEFLQASDMFLFCSKGDRNNKELNPIAIKEAMEYRDVVKLMYNLDVYCGKYDGRDDVFFLTGNLEQDADTLLASLGIPKDVVDEELIIIGTYPNLKSRETLTHDCIASLQSLGRKIMLVSHYPVPPELQKMVDYYIYDKHNPLTHHSYYTRFYNHTYNYDAEININGLRDTNQSLTVLVNLFNGFKAAKQLGYKSVFYITYDVIVNDKDVSTINESFTSIKGENKAYLGLLNTPFGKGIETTAMTMDVDFFLNTFDDVRDANTYNNICGQRGSQNFLEDYLMKVINGVNQQHVTLIDKPEETFLVNSGRGVSSNSEYYSILPIRDKSNEYMFYFYSYNIDDRFLNVTISEDDQVIFSTIFQISKTREYKKDFKYTGKPISVLLEFYDGENNYKTERYDINESTLDRYNHTGYFKWKNIKPRIKLVHIQTTRNSEAEQQSRASLERVRDYGWEYILHTNEPYKSLPPAHTCMRPECVSMELFDQETMNRIGTALTPPHYGCFDSFRSAVLSEFHDCDFLMVCEGDCLIETEIGEFIAVVEGSCQTIKDHNIGYMSFGDKALLEQGWVQSPVIEEINDQMYITNKIIGIQCIMFPSYVANYLKEQFRTHKWDASDYFFNVVMGNSPWKMGIVHNRITTQADGFSLIDQTNKTFIKK